MAGAREPIGLRGALAQLRANPLRWLVTGSAGFIGSHLVEALLRLGQRVVSLDNFETGHRQNLDEVHAVVGDERWRQHEFLEADIVDPTAEYTAAQFALDASAVIRDIHARGRLPILAGGTGFYYRVLTRGLFPGPGRDAELRGRLPQDHRAHHHGFDLQANRLYRIGGSPAPSSGRPGPSGLGWRCRYPPALMRTQRVIDATPRVRNPAVAIFLRAALVIS